ncbi:MAG: type II toxin-antitoxin system HicA family toxin [Alphaproteobacteria bacterium]
MSRTGRPASTLDRMRANPRADWTIADVERLCREEALIATPPHRGSHYKVRSSKGGTVLTIPAHRPIKPVYIRALVALADALRNDKDEA